MKRPVRLSFEIVTEFVHVLLIYKFHEDLVDYKRAKPRTSSFFSATRGRWLWRDCVFLAGFRAWQRAIKSKGNGPTWSYFEILINFMFVLVIYKFDEGPINIEGATLRIPVFFSPLYRTTLRLPLKIKRWCICNDSFNDICKRKLLDYIFTPMLTRIFLI